MVRFSIFQKGLKNHVENMYKNFRIINGKPYSKKKIKTLLICSLLDISSIPITSNILKDLSLYKFALDLSSNRIKIMVFLVYGYNGKLNKKFKSVLSIISI
jgi:hypothetical protein